MANGAQLYDIVIIGAGHNGLVCAAYLAKAGLKVRVLERRNIAGGAAVTEEFHPGFRNSLAAYTVSLLNPKVIRDLELPRFGLKIVERRINNFWPMADGRHLLLGGNADTQAEFAKFSEKDAQAAPRYFSAVDRIADVLRDLVLQAPPNIGGGIAELLKAGQLANRMRQLDMDDRRLLSDLFTQSAADFLSGWFESEEIKGALAFESIVGNFASPYAPGTAYVLLHHLFGEVNGKKGIWGHAIGGMGAITQAMAESAKSRGVEISLDTPVAKVIVENGRACGVITEAGEKIRARSVASNVNPKLLFLEMLDRAAVDKAFRRRIERWKCGSATFRMNVALSELPDFTCLPGREMADHHTAGIIIGPDLEYLDRAYSDARRYGWSSEPVVEMLIPSTLDDSLAPPGQHVASLFCQHFAPELPGGADWDDNREEAADVIIETVNHHAPNFAESIIARQILSPKDMETELGLVGGDLFHGALSLDQIFSNRPVMGYADYRAPVAGLYMCGSATHPGGGVTGAPGHNAAKAIIKDFRLRRVR